MRVLVGRAGELARLRELLDGERPVVVLGEAGVGKTALLREALAEGGRRVFEGGGLATLSWLSYLPLRRALGRELGNGDAAHVALEVERSVGDGVLLLDDLQWADRETRRTLAYLAGRIRLVGAVRRGVDSAPLVEELTGLGSAVLELEPLVADTAAELALSLRPDLSRSAVERLVRRSGGNPLLIEELAASGEPTESLMLSVHARLRDLGTRAREAMVLLSLAGRPLPSSQLGPGSTQLGENGLVVVQEGNVSVRHALLAEVTGALLSEEERRAAHARLSRLLRDPGEAARHHAQAGERAPAHRKALVAAKQATTPGERATHLALAAFCADGRRAERLRLEAAWALVATGLYDRAGELVASVGDADGPVAAERRLLEAKVATARADDESAMRLLEDALGRVRGSGTELELQLAAERILAAEAVSPDGTADDATALLRDARAALALAERLGAHRALARLALGCARRCAGQGGWRRDVEAAVVIARAESDIALEFEAGESLVAERESDSGGRRGRRLASELIERARELQLVGWERRFRTRAAWLDLHGGAFRDAFEAGEQLACEALEPWQRYLVTYVTAQAAIDLGMNERARELVAELYLGAASTGQRLRQALWARADLDFWSGRPREAIDAADEALARFPESTSTFLRVTRAGACVDLGIDPGDPVIDPQGPFLAGARPELEGLSLLARGLHAEAAGAFGRAAGHWRGQHVRGELRALWEQGEALRRQGRPEAVDVLLAAERRAEQHEHTPVLRRIHRSLRLAGVRRSAARTQEAGGLTGREREVVELVAEGCNNAEIARRLGISRPTVVRIVSSATRKLGAKTRAQAAAAFVSSGAP